MSDTKIEVEWTLDCQGKQDYDADIVRLSSRYYPRGGGFSVFDTGTGEWTENSAHPEIQPCAYSSILVGDEEVAASGRVEGETEADVKVKVEAWAREKMAVVIAAVRTALAEPKP